MWFLRALQYALPLILTLTCSAAASSLRISPVTVEVPVSAKSATLRIRNEGTSPVTVQMRVFQWLQVEGADNLEATKNVVVSPPITELLPKRDYVIRMIRIAKHPVQLEENYRLLIDELPGRTERANGTVALMIRQSLPVRFKSEHSRVGQIFWVALKKKGRVEIVAKNTGTTRVKISRLSVTAGNDRRILHHDGLSGYILGGSVKRWTAPIAGTRIAQGERLSISAQSSSGRIKTHATLRAGN